jgi:integrase
MSAAGPLRVPGGDGQVFPAVLDDVVLHGPAARLAAMIDPAFLAGAGWDPRTRMLSMPAGHPMLGRRTCALSGCAATAQPGCGGLCRRCLTWLGELGMTTGQISSAEELPPPRVRETRCAVPGCRREITVSRALLCKPHTRQFERMRPSSLEQFLGDPRVRPAGPYRECAVTACSRAGDGGKGYCNGHYLRWTAASKACPGLDAGLWARAEVPVTESGQVSLHGLPSLVAVEVLFGLWRRTLDDIKTLDTNLRSACRMLAVQQVATISGCDTATAGVHVGPLLRGLARYVFLALADPGSEQAKDVWDLAVFGHRGTLDFTGITQLWLRETAKRWAANDLPRHRGAGAGSIRVVLRGLARFSDSLRSRPDAGNQPAALGRADIGNFLNRLAYLESAGTLSRYQRNSFCCSTRAVLAGARALGLTRAGQPACGLPGDVTITAADIPAAGEPSEPSRDLPPEIMDVLCASLDTLRPETVRTGVEIAIDTGRRPDEIATLKLGCLTRDRDGQPVLIYDNIKARRDQRRLPVSEHTAAVITAQQARVAARYPATPPSDLVLLPSTKRNPAGRRHISVEHLEEAHRGWADSLGPLTTRDGTPFDPAKIVLYAYRHTYAQRHADAGVPIDVLARLMDHKHLDQTRGYYRVGEDRRRAAVDKVTTLSFDRHGNRTWQDARALLDAEHARYAIGQVAVPYGTCTEPSNVAAGGAACPVRFRCAGCDHFRTDVSYLPDLTAYLDDLLRTREKLTAMTGVDDWARDAATPPEQEISRIRQLIRQIENGTASLGPAERAATADAVTAIRKHRAATAAVHLGIPAIRAARQEHTA